MKKYFLLGIVLFSLQIINAATLRVDVKDSTASGEPGSSFILEAYVHNLSAAATVIQVTRVTNDIPDGWSTTLCFGSSCYPSMVDQASEAVDPGDSLFFDITFNTDSIPSSGQALMVFQDLVSGDADSVLFSVSTMPQLSLKITYDDTLLFGQPGDLMVMKGYAHNLTESNTVVTLKRVTNDLPENWSTMLCFGSSCYPPGVSEATETIGANDSLFFDITFNTADQPGQGSALLRFSDLLSGQETEQTFSVITVNSEPSFSISVIDSSATIDAGSVIELGGFVYNKRDDSLSVTLFRKENNLPPNWSTSLCYGSCASSMDDTLTQEIGPGDSLAYSVTFATDTQAGSGDALLQFFIPGESDTLEQRFSVETNSTAIGQDGNGELIRNFKVLGNYPNPFNPETVISYQLPALSNVELVVYNTLGKKVATLISRRQNAGLHSIRFNAFDLSSGTYLYQLKAGKQVLTGKMLLLK